MNALIGHKSSVLVPSRREGIWDLENRLWNQTDWVCGLTPPIPAL